MRTIQFKLNLPSDVKTWLERQAEINGSSQNSEVIRAIRAAMARDALSQA
ncbi:MULTISPECIES: Arc family DNA-binding protein [unclassified Haematobacter]|nr:MULTISPECIES: Arc family DNA-binding protein [unclassified Haematobacter]